MYSYRKFKMLTVQKLEALASRAVLVNYESLESVPHHMRELAKNLFRFDVRYNLSSRLAAVFDDEGNRGKLFLKILFYCKNICLGTVNTDIELCVANDMQISGTCVSINKDMDRYELSYENATQMIQLGKTDMISDNKIVGHKYAYVLNNEIHEIGKFYDGEIFENNLKLLKSNVFEIESIQYFKQKKLLIKNIYLKEQN